MEIKIRNINPAAVKKIDELANKKNQSRNEYLKNMLEVFTGLEEFKKFEERYQTVIRSMEIIVQHNSDVLNNILKIIEEDEADQNEQSEKL
ncbi:MAG: hypothetical protein RSC76_08940 [Oscillospiraceae bacterium]